MSAQTQRLFVALPLPEAVTEALTAIMGQLARQLPEGSVRWVTAAQMHLTLAFLGETPVAQLPALRAVLDALAARHPAHRPVLGTLGCFPNPRRPRVFWAGLDGDLTPLLALQAELVAQLAPLGWPPEARPFNAHITLGRTRQGARPLFPQQPPRPPALTVSLDRLQLFQSRLGPGGARYQVLHSAPLRPLT